MNTCHKTKRSVAVVYVDYTCAFDTASHKKLVSKLTAYGIQGIWLAWIENLHSRLQQMRVRTLFVVTVLVAGGVVQGSILGPLLSIIYKNDVVSIFKDNRCTCKFYADDLKLYSQL